MTNEQKFKAVMKIYNLLQKSDLGWYGWYWWELKDSWFSQFNPKEINDIAKEMAKNGMIETNGFSFRRKEKTLKEKIILKLWG